MYGHSHCKSICMFVLEWNWIQSCIYTTRGVHALTIWELWRGRSVCFHLLTTALTFHNRLLFFDLACAFDVSLLFLWRLDKWMLDKGCAPRINYPTGSILCFSTHNAYKWYTHAYLYTHIVTIVTTSFPINYESFHATWIPKHTARNTFLHYIKPTEFVYWRVFNYYFFTEII